MSRYAAYCCLFLVIGFSLICVNRLAASPDKHAKDANANSAEKRIEIRVTVDGNDVAIEGLENGKKIDLGQLGPSIHALLKQLPKGAHVGADVEAIFIADDEESSGHDHKHQEAMEAVLKRLPAKLSGKVNVDVQKILGGHDADDEDSDANHNVQIQKIIRLADDDATHIHPGDSDGKHGQMKVWVQKSGDHEDADQAHKTIIIKKMSTDGKPAMKWTEKRDDDADQEKKMIVVRLDGEHGGVNWSDKEDNVFQFEPGEKRQMIFMPGSSAKFVLGVALEPISDLVRSQLKIDEQVGIGVVSVIEDSPAAQAGLQKYDVIVKANGSNIRELQDLIGPIERAGERQKALKLTLIRAGERLSVKVSPQSAAHGHESHDEHENENEHESDSEIKVLKKQLQELRAVVEELKRAG